MFLGVGIVAESQEARMSIAIPPNRSEVIRQMASRGMSPEDIRARTGWPMGNIRAALQKAPKDKPKSRRV
jgi:DNA-directed RNA polymerase specialized sigma24 family protein